MAGTIGPVFWLILAVVLFLIEGLSVQLVSIWFACGALVALLASFLGAPVWLQLFLFLASSIGVLFLGRPVLSKRLNLKREATNADMVIGQTGLVLEEVNNLKQTGRVNANGLDWTARAELDDVIIPVQSQVKILRIDGVKLIVEPTSRQPE